MVWKILYHPRVINDLEGSGSSVVQRILKIIDSLKEGSRTLSNISMRDKDNRNLWFLKSMGLRIIYECKESEMCIVILCISRDTPKRELNTKEKTKTHLSGVGLVKNSM